MSVLSSIGGRTLEEILTDKLLLLYLLNDTNKWMDEAKIHKLIFLSEKEMNRQGKKGFNFNFIKLRRGPYSGSLKEDMEQLMEKGLIDNRSHVPTERGQLILKNFHQVFERNRSFTKEIRKVNGKYSGINGEKLAHIVHGMINPETTWMTIHETPSGNYLLKRLKNVGEKKTFHLTESEIESMDRSIKNLIFTV
jgi:uncharacterized protein YwgA